MTLKSLKNMSTEEKMKLMELLWQDLSANDLASPLWHKKALEERKKNVLNGKFKYVEWQDAQEFIKKSIHENSNSRSSHL